MFRFSLICLDIDGTMIDHEFEDSGPREKLRRVLAELTACGVRVVFASGRSGDEVRGLVAQGVVPSPDFLISDFGAHIFEWLDDVPWESDFGFPVGDWRAELIDEAARSLPQITPRADERSGAFKRTFYLTDESMVPRLRQELLRRGVGARIFYVPPRYLYLIPEACGKEIALSSLVRRLDLSREEVLVVGDSEVDKPLFERFSQGILVGNASPALKEDVGRTCPDIYVSVNRCAAGVVEGIERLRNG